MRVAIDAIDDPDRRELYERISDMEAATGTASFAKKYADFMQLAANHVAVFQPFFQGLAQLVGS